MPGNEAKSLAEQAAASVQEAIEAAESEARERIARAQGAVDRLLRQADELRAAVTSLGNEVADDGGASAEVPTAPEIDPTPVTVPEPEPAREPEPTPPTTPEPEPPLEPEPQPPEVPEPTPPDADRPSTEQLIEQLKGGATGSDEGAARLVAMNLALDGKSRKEVERHLAEEYELADASRILDDVYSRVGK
jgi:outer membrane biosynthesis protein TonB